MHPLLLAALALLAFPAHALAALPGQACSEVGKTTMDDNKRNIIACLYNDTSSALIWKSMSTSQVSCGSGQAVTSISNGIPVCGTVAAAAAAPSSTPSSTPASGSMCGQATWSSNMSNTTNACTPLYNCVRRCYVSSSLPCSGTTIATTRNIPCDQSCAIGCPSGYTLSYISSSFDRSTCSDYATATCVAK